MAHPADGGGRIRFGSTGPINVAYPELKRKTRDRAMVAVNDRVLAGAAPRQVHFPENIPASRRDF
jgi:hypothetical protein